MRPPTAESTRFIVTPAALADLELLFNNRAGGRLRNDYTDAGYNCYAKALVTTYLARLQGLPADLHEGRAIMVWAAGQNSRANRVEPHAWSALRSGEPIDLSIGRFAGQAHFTTGHRSVKDTAPVKARMTTEACDFERYFCFFPSLPRGGYLFYHSQKRRPFYFEDLHATPVPVNSPPTLALLERFRGEPVFAKAILHLHRLIEGHCAPLAAADQLAAWTALAAWPVDAVPELEAAWRGAKRPPAREPGFGPGAARGRDAAA